MTDLGYLFLWDRLEAVIQDLDIEIQIDLFIYLHPVSAGMRYATTCYPLDTTRRRPRTLDGRGTAGRYERRPSIHRVKSLPPCL
jgi:hypothetical protein